MLNDNSLVIHMVSNFIISISSNAPFALTHRLGLKAYTRDKTQPNNVPSVGLIDRPMAPARYASNV